MAKAIPGSYQYRALTEGYSPQRFWHSNKFDLLQHIGKFSLDDYVLDAGCGSGNISFFLAKKVSKVMGVDINHEAIDFAKKHAQRLNLNNIDFIAANLKKLPFNDKSFSKAIVFEVIEHLNKKDYEEMLAEIYRTLKPSGLLYLTTPNKASLWPLVEIFLDTFKLVPHLGGSQHILKLTPAQVEKIVTKSGFKLIKSGSLNHLSPLFSLFSWQLGKKALNFEIRYLQFFGPTIWLIAKK